MKSTTERVKCEVCGKQVGKPGLVKHMRTHDASLAKNFAQGQVIPGEHPVEQLEKIIARLIQQETGIQDKLSQLSELQAELAALGRLREKLEAMVTEYKNEKSIAVVNSLT